MSTASISSNEGDPIRSAARAQSSLTVTNKLDRVSAGAPTTQHQEWQGLFWLARLLTGDHDAAMTCVLEAIDCPQDPRRQVIAAACQLLKAGIREAMLDFLCNPGEPKRLTECPSTTVDNFEVLCDSLDSMNIFLRFIWVLCFAERSTPDEVEKLLSFRASLVREAAGKAAVELAYAVLERSKSVERT